MHASRHATRELEDVKVHVKLKLAGLWVASCSCSCTWM